jgi:hypothetical protein
MVFVSGQANGSRFDSQRSVLADKNYIPALGCKIERAGKNSRIVTVRAESDWKDRRVGVIEFYLQRAVLSSDRYRPVEATELDTQIVEHAECFSGKPSQFGMMPFTFEFTDHDQGKDHVVLGESCDSPRIGQ